MTAAHWQYPVELREALAACGLAPTTATPPRIAREALDDLYRGELRRLRDRLAAGEIEKAGYADAVIVLRRKYWPLTLPLDAWERICAMSGAQET